MNVHVEGNYTMPCSNLSAHNLAGLGQIPARVSPMLDEVGPKLAEIGQSWPKFGQHQPKLAEIWSKSCSQESQYSYQDCYTRLLGDPPSHTRGRTGSATAMTRQSLNPSMTMVVLIALLPLVAVVDPHPSLTTTTTTSTTTTAATTTPSTTTTKYCERNHEYTSYYD